MPLTNSITIAWLGNGVRALSVAIAAFCILATSASAVERKLLVASFENIMVIGDIDVSVQTGRPVSAKASGDKRILDSLKLERTGTTLRIRVLDLSNDDKRKPVTEPLRVMLTTPKIQNAVLSGNGKLNVSSIRQPDSARVVISGNGAISVGSVNADKLIVDIDGNGKVDIGGGSVRDGRVTIIGSGQFAGAALEARKLRLEHNGNATSAATVSEGSDIFNRGSGRIDIGGSGTCFIKLAGRATINCTRIDGESNSQ